MTVSFSQGGLRRTWLLGALLLLLTVLPCSADLVTYTSQESFSTGGYDYGWPRQMFFNGPELPMFDSATGVLREVILVVESHLLTDTYVDWDYDPNTSLPAYATLAWSHRLTVLGFPGVLNTAERVEVREVGSSGNSTHGNGRTWLSGSVASTSSTTDRLQEFIGGGTVAFGSHSEADVWMTDSGNRNASLDFGGYSPVDWGRTYRLSYRYDQHQSVEPPSADPITPPIAAVVPEPAGGAALLSVLALIALGTNRMRSGRK